MEIREDLLNCRVDNFKMIVKGTECNDFNITTAARAPAEHRRSCQRYAGTNKGFLFPESQIKIINTIRSRVSGVPGLTSSTK